MRSKPRRSRSSRSGGVLRRRGWGSAVRTPYKGRVYASKAEARYARYLDTLQKAGEVRRWEAQVRLTLKVNGKKVCDMVPDFAVWLRNGDMEYREVKGHPTPTWRLKLKLFTALHPNAVYRVVSAREALAL